MRVAVTRAETRVFTLLQQQTSVVSRAARLYGLITPLTCTRLNRVLLMFNGARYNANTAPLGHGWSQFSRSFVLGGTDLSCGIRNRILDN